MQNNQNDENFTIAEIKGRKKYKELNHNIFNKKNMNYFFTPDRYCNWDVEYPQIDRVDEIKNRDIKTSKYFSEGYWLEKTKYDALIQHKKAYYIQFYNDDIILIWDLHNIPQPEFKWVKATKDTVNHYGEELVWKEAAFVQFDNASIVKEGNVLKRTERMELAKQLREEEIEDKRKEWEDKKRKQAEQDAFAQNAMRQLINRDRQAIN